MGSRLQKSEMEKGANAGEVSPIAENGFPKDPEMGSGHVSIERIEKVYRCAGQEA